MNWRRYNWAKDAVLPLAFATLRACWLWPWLELVRRWLAPSQPGPFLPLALMIGLGLGAMATSRHGAARRSLNAARVLSASVGLVAVVLVLWWRFFRLQYRPWDGQWVAALGAGLTHWGAELPGPFVALLAAAYLWLQGLRDGHRSLNSDDAWQAFGACFVSLVLSLPAAALDGRGAPAGTVHIVLLSFAAGMVALAVSNLQRAQDPGRQVSGSHPPATRYWLGTVASTIIVLLGLGVALSLLVAPEVIAPALRWTFTVLGVVRYGLHSLLVILSYPIFLVLRLLLDWLQSLASSTSLPELTQLRDLQRQLEALPRAPVARGTGSAETYGWLGLAALVVAIGLSFALVLRRYWAGERAEVEETRETMFSPDLLREQLSGLWREWVRRLRRAPVPARSPFLSLEGEDATRRLLRAIYQALLAAAAARGRPRSRGQTPLEYQQALQQALPDSQDALSVITGGYLQARYAPEAPTREQTERARRAWAQLQESLAALDRQEGG